MVGISRLVITRRERAVMLEPRGKGIVMWTLCADELRDVDTYSGGINEDETADSDMRLVRQLIKKQTQHWDRKMAIDPVQDRLQEIISSKKKALKRSSKNRASQPAKTEASNVINIMDALKKSVAAESRIGK